MKKSSVINIILCNISALLIGLIFVSSVVAATFIPHPRIFLTPAILSDLRNKVANGDANILALKAWGDSHIGDTGYDTGNLNWQGYRGSGYKNYVTNYALLYQIYKTINPAAANNYAAKAIAVLNGLAVGAAVGQDTATSYGLAAIRVGESTDVTVNVDEGAALGISMNSYKLGYSAREVGPCVALGLDWLYDRLTSSQINIYRGMLYRWIDWYRGVRSSYNRGVVYNGIRYYEDKSASDLPGEDSNLHSGATGTGYGFNNTGHNFDAGYFIMLGMGSIASDNGSIETGQYVTLFLDKFNNITKPALVDQYNLKGGDSPEGWNYRSGWDNYLKALEAYMDATGSPAIFSGFPFPEEFFRSYLHASKNNLRGMNDHGDWTGSYSGVPYGFVLYYQAHLLEKIGSSLAPTAKYFLLNAVYPDSVDYMTKILFYPYNTIASFNETSLSYRSIGTGMVTMRDKWGSGEIWAAIQLGGKHLFDHEHYDEGHFVIQRGSDYLVVNGAGQSAAYHNTIQFGSGTQQQSMGVNTNYHSIKTFYDDNESLLYVKADIARAYQRQYQPSYSTKFLRKFVFLRPDTFIVYDLAESGVGYEHKSWTINFNYNVTPVVSSDNRLVESTVGNSKISMRILNTDAYTITRNRETNWNGSGWKFNITPAVDVLQNDFLNVFSIGGSSMIPPPQVRIDALETVAMHQKSSVKNKLVIFSKNYSDIPPSADILYTLSPTAPLDVIAVDMKSSFNYYYSAVQGAGGLNIRISENSFSGATSITSTPEGILDIKTQEKIPTPPTKLNISN